MTLAPLLAASPLVQLHTLAAALALGAGAAVLISAKGTPRHRLLGRIGALAMLVTALSSFGIPGDGRFSVIHLLSLGTLFSLGMGYRAIRARKIAAHAGFMRGAWLGLLMAGLFTLWPGRLMHQVVFGL